MIVEIKERKEEVLKMLDSSRKKITNEYEVLFDEMMNQLGEGRLEIVEDDIISKESLCLYIKAIKCYTKNNYEEGRRLIDLFLDKVLEAKKIENNNFIAKLRNNIHKIINREIKLLDNNIEEFVEKKSYYINKLKYSKGSEKEFTELNIEYYWEREFYSFKDTINGILRSIDLETSKKSKMNILLSKIVDMTKKILQSMFFGMMVWGAIKLRCKIFKDCEMGNRLKEHPSIILEVAGVRVLEKCIAKNIIEQIRKNKKEVSTNKKVDVRKEYIQCIHNSKKLNNNISLNVR